MQGRLLGTEEFLLGASANSTQFEARSAWVTLVGEVLPRALLLELGLPALMLGSADRGEFLVLLPDPERAAAGEEFLKRAAAAIEAVTLGTMRLIWGATENLGDWTVIRKRLNDGLRGQRHSVTGSGGFFGAFEETAVPRNAVPLDLRNASAVGFSFDFPALLAAEGGTYRWDLGLQATVNNISLSRHQAANEHGPAPISQLAKRSKGISLWGVLRGEFDDFPARLRRVQSVEEHVQLALLYKQFLSGEIELLCSQPDYFQRVTVLYVASSEFAIYGSWDALLGFAQELERVFARFVQENLKELPGGEAKTITMAVTIANSGDSIAKTYEQAGVELELAKASDKDCLYFLGRVLEWRQLTDAADLKDAIVRLSEEFRGGRQFLTQLHSLYKKVETSGRTEEERLRARALRFQRRFAHVGNRREREYQKLRLHLMKEMSGKNLRGRLKLRPEGLVALEWARLSGE